MMQSAKDSDERLKALVKQAENYTREILLRTQGHSHPRKGNR